MPTTRSCRSAAHSVLSLAAITAAILAASCRSTSESTPPEVSPDTWAVVNGREITRGEVETTFRRTRNPAQTLSDQELLTAKLGVLEDLIVQEILMAKARESKLEVSESEIDAAYAEAKQGMSDEAFQQELSRRTLTAADMREGLRRELLTRKLMEQEVRAKVAVSDQEVTSFFDANRERFNFAEEVYHLAQIIVTPEREPQLSNRTGDDAMSAEAAAAKTQMIMERLKGGTPFGDLAADFSEDPETAPRGGDLGYVPVSRLKQAPPALRDAVLKVEPGTVNVVSQGGAHTIVLVVAHEPAGQRDLSTPAVREGITNTLRGRKEQLLQTAFLTSARSDASVTNHFARRLMEAKGEVPPALVSAATDRP